MVVLTALTIAGAGAIAALGGYAIYRGGKVTGSSRPALRGVVTAAALFVWTAVTLPVAAFVLTGGLLIGLAVLPILLAIAGGYLLARPRRQVGYGADPDTITVN